MVCAMTEGHPTPHTWRTTGDTFLPRRWRYLPLTVAALLAAVGWWTFSTVEKALKDEFADGLQTILNSNVEALDLWIEARFSAAQVLARQDVIAECTEELVAVVAEHPGDREALLQCASMTRIREHLRMQSMALDFEGFIVFDDDSMVLASTIDAVVGQAALDDHRDLVQRILQGATVISRPFRSLVAEVDEGGKLRVNRPIMYVGTPIRDAAGGIIGGLGLRVDPEKDFTRILSMAKAGDTGNTYAFDRKGVMLSHSRFEDELRLVGLIPDTEDSSSILTLAVRDPGVDMTRGDRPKTPRARHALTRMAADAVQGNDGIDVEGYRDYRGVESIGAWRWLARYDFGVATESAVEEAYKALRVLRTANIVLYGLLVLFAAGMVFESRFIFVLRSRIAGALRQAERLGQYTLEEKIGEGGMASVYRASHVMLRRPVAIKLLHGAEITEGDLVRFEREVQLTSQLTHPNTIAIFDYGRTPEGVFYYVMEYLDGLSLRRIVKTCGAQPEGRVIHILRQICASLEEAHGRGLIHRDIKPANVIVCERGGMQDVVKVLDFGLVKDLEGVDAAAVTSPSVITGTPHYISPEAIRSASDVDRRADIYSIGVVGYFLLTGTEMFGGLSAAEVLAKHLAEVPELPSVRLGRALDPALEQAIMACLAKDPDDRPQTAREFSDRLAACASAGAWGETEARAWWAAESARCRDLGDDEGAPATARTLDVAYRRRHG